jgi:HsdM N-terminal domain
MNHQALSSFIWSVADLLRGDYKQSDYGKLILPFTVLRRLDCVLEATKAKVLAELAAKQKAGLNPDPSSCAPPARASTTPRPWTWASSSCSTSISQPARTSPLRFQPWLTWRASSSPT